jgi:nucleotide-binding universal stress UspA family protein
MTTETHAAVVAGVDGSEPSLLALDYAADEAARRHQPLRIVIGCAWPLFIAATGGGAGIPLDEGVVEVARGVLEAAASRVGQRQPAVDVTIEVTRGSPAGVLVDESERASVVVVGSRGRGGFASLLAGSVATQLATHAHCPVIVVRPGADPAAAATLPVVVGVDGFERTEAAVGFAFEEASSRGVSLTAVHVWAEPPRAGRDEFKPVAYDYDEARKEAARSLAEALAGFGEKYPDVPVFRELICGLDPAYHLLRASEGAGLVVVGSRGRGEFSGFVLGSLGQSLVHHATCPVAVVRGVGGEDRD